VNVSIDPFSAFFLETKIEKIVSHFASHRMATQYNGKSTVLFVHGFHSFHRLGQVAISGFGAEGGQSPAATTTTTTTTSSSSATETV
jgi:hypothetical protein